MFVCYDMLTKAMTEVNYSFENLENTIKKLNFENNSSKELRIFEGLREMGVKMQNTIGEQCTTFKSKIYSLIRYEKENMWTIKEIIDQRNKINFEYAKQGSPVNPVTTNDDKVLEFKATLPLEEPVKNNKNYLAIQNAFWEYVVLSEI